MIGHFTILYMKGLRCNEETGILAVHETFGVDEISMFIYHIMV